MQLFQNWAIETVKSDSNVAKVRITLYRENPEEKCVMVSLRQEKTLPTNVPKN